MAYQSACTGKAVRILEIILCQVIPFERNVHRALQVFRYLNHTNTFVFTIISPITQDKFYVSSTIISHLAQFPMLFIRQLMHTTYSVKQLQNK